jgi:hypothetical protein
MILSIFISNHANVSIKVYAFFYVHDSIEDVMSVELKDGEHYVLGPKTFNINKSKFYYKIFSIYVESEILGAVRMDDFEHSQEMETLDVSVKSKNSNLILEKNVFSSTTTKLLSF